MRSLVVLCSFLLLSQVSLTSQTPADILREAIKNSREMCGFVAQKQDLTKSPPMWEGVSQSDTEKVRKLSLKLMFREGRYQTGLRVTENPHSGNFLITFEPESRGQLEALEGEDKELNKILNNLKGRVLIDQKTHGIVSVYSELKPESLRLRFKKLPFIKLESLELQMEQAKVGHEWVPNTFKLTFSGEFIKKDFYRTYSARFHCTSLAE